jgi:hypothetical protein
MPHAVCPAEDGRDVIRVGESPRKQADGCQVAPEVALQDSFARPPRDVSSPRRGTLFSFWRAHPAPRPGLLLSQSLYGSNVSAPAMATPIGRSVCSTRMVSPWWAITSDSRL